MNEQEKSILRVTDIENGAETFITGGVREIAIGKGRYDLISPVGLRRLALRYEAGTYKYPVTRNWEKGLSPSRCIDSAMRHINQFLEGDTEEDHLAAACWNLFAVMHYEEKLPHIMDIPTRPEYKEDNMDLSKSREETK